MKGNYKMENNCEHKWVYQCTDYKCDRGGYASQYTKIDTYYCERCLEQKEIIAKDVSSREKPYWYQGRTL